MMLKANQQATRRLHRDGDAALLLRDPLAGGFPGHSVYSGAGGVRPLLPALT